MFNYLVLNPDEKKKLVFWGFGGLVLFFSLPYLFKKTRREKKGLHMLKIP